MKSAMRPSVRGTKQKSPVLTPALDFGNSLGVN